MLKLPAQLTLRDATAALAVLESEIATHAEPVVEIDAGGVTQIDSSALAVLLACRRSAEARQRGFAVFNAPERLSQLARLYGVQDLLGLQQAV
jgi:phospholipid transport system transporter-binding protein